MMNVKILFLIVLLLFTAGLLRGAETDVAERENAQRQVLSKQLGSIQQELNLDRELTKRIRSSLEEELKAAAERINAKVVDAEFDNIFDFQLEEGLEKALLKVAEEQVPTEKFDAFSGLVVDARLLRNEWDQRAQRAFASYLDETLSLSLQQEAAVLNILKDHWHPGWNSDVEDLTMEGPDCVSSIFKFLVFKDVKSILSESQWVVYEDVYEFRVEIQMMENEEIDVERLREAANQLMNLRVDELNEIFELTDSQKKMLSVGRKGAVADLLSEWQGLSEKLGGDLGQMFMNLEALEMCTQSLSRQGCSQKKWQGILRKTLSEEQLEKVHQRENHRASKLRDQMTFYLLRSTLSGHDYQTLKLKQIKALTDLLHQEIAVQDSTDIISYIFEYLEIDEEKIEPIYTKTQWEKLQPMLQEDREMLRQMKAEQAEGAGDG